MPTSIARGAISTKKHYFYHTNKAEIKLVYNNNNITMIIVN